MKKPLTFVGARLKPNSNQKHKVISDFFNSYQGVSSHYIVDILYKSITGELIDKSTIDANQLNQPHQEYTIPISPKPSSGSPQIHNNIPNNISQHNSNNESQSSSNNVDKIAKKNLQNMLNF